MVNLDEFPTFWAMRPDWLSDEERATLVERYPDLVEKFADCWQEEDEAQEN